VNFFGFSCAGTSSFNAAQKTVGTPENRRAAFYQEEEKRIKIFSAVFGSEASPPE
jgi:hypothetical protein